MRANREQQLELLKAAKRGDIESVRKLLTLDGIDPNFFKYRRVRKKGPHTVLSYEMKKSKTPLEYAMKSGNVEMVKLLLSHPDIKINQDFGFIMHAVLHDQDAILDELLKNKAFQEDVWESVRNCNLSTTRPSYLHEAAAHGNFHAVDLFLQMGVDVNIKTFGRYTPLAATMWEYLYGYRATSKFNTISVILNHPSVQLDLNHSTEVRALHCAVEGGYDLTPLLKKYLNEQLAYWQTQSKPLAWYQRLFYYSPSAQIEGINFLLNHIGELSDEKNKEFISQIALSKPLRASYQLLQKSEQHLYVPLTNVLSG